MLIQPDDIHLYSIECWNIEGDTHRIVDGGLGSLAVAQMKFSPVTGLERQRTLNRAECLHSPWLDIQMLGKPVTDVNGTCRPDAVIHLDASG